VNFLTTEQFEKHFEVNENTIILSPNVAMIASLIGYEFDSQFDPYSAFTTASNHQKYDTAMIDIIEDQKFPYAKAKHEYNWLINAMIFVKNSGSLIAKLPPKILSQISQIKDVVIETVSVYDDCAIVKFVKSKTLTSTVVSYNDSIVQIDSTKVPILSQNIQTYYSYFNQVKDEDAFGYISLTGGGNKTCRQQFDDRVEWNPDRVICVSTGADNRKVDNGLNFYTFDEIADINRAVDCYYIPEDIDFDSLVNTLKSEKFLSFLSSVCYNNYQTFNKNFKKKVFNKKIIEFCNEE
jgi:hypothetical protein